MLIRTKGGSLEFLALLALVILLLFSGGLRFIVGAAMVWLAACVFNPPLDSGWIWFIAAIVSITASLSHFGDESNIQS